MANNESEEEKLFFFNFYKFKLNQLEYSESGLKPEQNAKPYSLNIQKILSQLIPESINNPKVKDNSETSKLINSFINIKEDKNLNTDFIIQKEMEQIINYKNPSGYELILKRKCYTFDKEKIKNIETDLMNQIKVRDQLNNYVKEYFFYRLISAHPAGVFAFDFSLTILKNQNIIVFELLTENGGVGLDKIYLQDKSICDINNSFDYFYQVVDVMDFIERRNLAYGDVKLENLLVDKMNRIRLIDYDISSEAGFNETITLKGIEKINGCTKEYASPEVWGYILKRKKHELCENLFIDPWKSDVYSCGILGLILSGAIANKETLKQINDPQIDKEGHDNFIIELIKKTQWRSKELINCNELTEKMQRLMQTCLEYDPKFRINFHQLKKILQNILNQKPLNEVDNLLKKIINNPYKTKEDLNKEKVFLLSNIKEKEDLIETLKKENCELKIIINENYHRTKEFSSNMFGLNYGIKDIPSLLSQISSLAHNLIVDFETKRNVNRFKNESPNKYKPWEKLPEEINNIPDYIKGIKQNYEDYNLDSQKILKEKPEKDKFQDPFKIKPKEDGKFNFGVTKYTINKDASENFLAKLLSEKAQKTILNSEYWTFWEQNLTKKEIFIIIELAGRNSIPIQRINFFGNENFDEECAEEYKKFVLKNNSLVGIDLYYLHFPINIKKELINQVFQVKQNIQYIIVERKEIDKSEASSLAQNLHLKLNNSNKYRKKDI